MHILLAEDECVTRESARISLEGQGYRVTAVDNGRAAIAAFTDAAFDIVLMDIKMPLMDGIEAVKHIRQSGGAASRVPIIALSGFSHDELPEMEKAGIDAFLEKPFEYTKLLNAVRRFDNNA